jgi:hypothetical protein
MSAKYGSFTRLISTVFRKDSQLITLRPNQSTTYTTSRDIQLPSGDTNKVLLGTDLVGVSGTLAIANGGTGQTAQQAAINALVGGAGTSGQMLRSNGTNVSMSAIQTSDVPTLNQNTTGTAANVTGTVAIGNGGTGQTTASAAINALLPSQTGQNGNYLTTNGSTASWATITQSGVQALSTITGATTITPSSSSTVYLCNSASSFTLGIATAVGINGYRLYIKNIGAGIVTVDPNSTETIDGQTTVSLSQYSSITIVASGGNWFLI